MPASRSDRRGPGAAPPSLNNMPPMRPSRFVMVAFCLLSVAALIAGCGGGSGSSTSTTTVSSAAEGRPAPPKSEFPSADGKTLKEVLKSAEGRSSLVAAPTGEAFYPGDNRYPFEVFQPDRTPVANTKVALYIAKAPPKSRNGVPTHARPLSQPATGPFPAAIESLATKPAFRSQTTAQDPNVATFVYTAEVEFPSDGEWRVLALIKQEGKTTAAVLPVVTVGEFTAIPRVGQRAPLIHTPTTASVGGDLSKVTTRAPPDTQNQVDYAEVLGKEPIVLLFATPKFCQSRTCSPVVDVAEQVKRLYGDKVAFIHMEIYNENNPSKGVRPQVRTFHLPSVPWLFVINRHGTIRSEIEGGFGVAKLTQEVKGVIGE